MVEVTNLAAVDGEIPEASGFDPADRGGDEGAYDAMRGWIPPDDRLWRHPSEMRSIPSVMAPTVAPRTRRGSWASSGAAVCLGGALMVTGLVMATSGASPGPGVSAGARSATTARSNTIALSTPPTTDPGTVQAAVAGNVAHIVASVRPSMVALRISRPAGVAVSTGVIAEAGGIVVTTASALAGATRISSFGPGSIRQPATVVGVDPTSNLAVLRIASDLPAATFDARDPLPGTSAIAVALGPSRGRYAAPIPSVYAGTVRTSGTAAGVDAASTTFASTTVTAPLNSNDRGCPLLNANGQVTGILETTRTVGSSIVSVFLPAELVMAVTRQLVATGTVNQGWLGLDTSNMPPPPTNPITGVTGLPGGALIDSVDSGSAAAIAGLRSGDVIVAVDGQAVHSTAELRTRLYGDPPGTTLTVAFERSSTTNTAIVVLAPTTNGAAAVGASVVGASP